MCERGKAVSAFVLFGYFNAGAFHTVVNAYKKKKEFKIEREKSFWLMAHERQVTELSNVLPFGKPE